MLPGPQPHPSANGSAAVVVLVVGLVAAGGVVAAVAATSSSTSLSGDAAPTKGSKTDAKQGPADWNHSCLVDANGDGTLDIAGLAGMPGAAAIPGIVDGRTGAVLYTDESLGKSAELVCVSRDWILAGSPNFELRLYNARNPDPPSRARGSDKLRHARMGKDCIAIRTDDGESMGLALPSGTVTTCDVELPDYVGRDEPGILGLTAEETQLTRGGKTYFLRKKSTGSGKLSLEVQQGGKTTLDLKLPLHLTDLRRRHRGHQRLHPLHRGKTRRRRPGIPGGLGCQGQRAVQPPAPRQRDP